LALEFFELLLFVLVLVRAHGLRPGEFFFDSLFKFKFLICPSGFMGIQIRAYLTLNVTLIDLEEVLAIAFSIHDGVLLFCVLVK